jgi:hypothetical protein
LLHRSPGVSDPCDEEGDTAQATKRYVLPK